MWFYQVELAEDPLLGFLWSCHRFVLGEASSLLPGKYEWEIWGTGWWLLNRALWLMVPTTHNPRIQCLWLQLTFICSWNVENTAAVFALTALPQNCFYKTKCLPWKQSITLNTPISLTLKIWKIGAVIRDRKCPLLPKIA